MTTQYEIKVRNFEQFQHYKHRNPPWIRVYYRLLRDRDFYRLDEHSKYVIIGLFLIASQNDNKIPFDTEWIRDELHLQTEPNWQVIINSRFIVPIDCDASTLLSTCKQNSSQSRVDNTDNTETEILSFSHESAKRSKVDEKEIFALWNSLPEIMHHRNISGHEKSIAKALKQFTSKEILLAIERYSLVRANKEGKYRNIYAWTLSEFLTRQNGYNIDRLNSDSWELPFLNNSIPIKRDTIGWNGESDRELAERRKKQTDELFDLEE